MIKVFVFVSGLTLASLPIGSVGAPIVFSFPKGGHELKVFAGSSSYPGPELNQVSGIQPAGFELGIEKVCAGGCPRSRFPLKELAWFSDLSQLSGAGNAPRTECASEASTSLCVDASDRPLLAGTMRLEGDWQLAALTDCWSDEFPVEMSATANETLVDLTNIKNRKPGYVSRPLADTFRLETSVKDLDELRLAGFPTTFSLAKAAPEWCERYGDDSTDCVLLLLRYEPFPAPTPTDRLASHFAHLYSLMSIQPKEKWSPFVESGEYCLTRVTGPVVGGGHPRCLGGYASY